MSVLRKLPFTGPPWLASLEVGALNVSRGPEIRRSADIKETDGLAVHGSSRKPRKNGCRTFPSADFARYLIRRARNLLRESLRLPDERREAPFQVGGQDLVEAVIALAGIDKVVALAPADVEPVPPVAVERKTGDS